MCFKAKASNSLNVQGGMNQTNHIILFFQELYFSDFGALLKTLNGLKVKTNTRHTRFDLKKHFLKRYFLPQTAKYNIYLLISAFFSNIRVN